MTDYRGCLEGLFVLGEARTRSISAENPTGAPGAGGRAASNLGPGRKGRPCIDLPRRVDDDARGNCRPRCHPAYLAHHARPHGPGGIRAARPGAADVLGRGGFPVRRGPLGRFLLQRFRPAGQRRLAPRRGEPERGVQLLLPDAFCRARAGDDREPAPRQGPGAVLSDHLRGIGRPAPGERRVSMPSGGGSPRPRLGRDFTILDGVKGRGHYVGTYLAWAALAKHWWGEGEIKFYLDGDGDFPTICGTGTEDYAGGAWCFSGNTIGAPESYSTPFLGYRYHEMRAKRQAWFGTITSLHGIYRWHVMDPIHFAEAIRVDDPADRPRRPELFRARRRCRLGRLLVSDRAAYAVSSVA